MNVRNGTIAIMAVAGCLAHTACRQDQQENPRIAELERRAENLSDENGQLLEQVRKLEAQDKPGELNRLREEIQTLNRQLGKLEDKANDYDRLAKELETTRASVREAQAAATPPPPPTPPAPATVRETPADPPPADPPPANATATAKSASTGVLDRDGKVRQDLSDAVVVIEGDKSVGTGFLAQESGAIYFYTAAHVLCGNSKLTVRNASGRQFAKFGGIEVAEGADLVRLKLAEPYEHPLTIAPPDEAIPIGTAVAALGNGGGQGVVAVETGKVLGTSGESLEIDAAVIQGNSGGPLLVANTGSVVGLITHLTARRNDLWSQGTRQGQVRRFACRVNLPRKWLAMSAATFMADDKTLGAFDEQTLLGFALSSLESIGTPTLSGAMGFATPEQSEVIRRNRDHPVVMELTKLDGDLQSGKVRLGAVDRKKRLASILGSLRTRLGEGKATLKPEALNPYHRALAEDSLAARTRALEALDGIIRTLR